MEETPKYSLKSQFLARLARFVLKCLFLTYRIEWIEGREILEGLNEKSRPRILCLWHNRIIFFGINLDNLTKRGFKVTIMISPSEEGDLGTIMGVLAGAEVVRGSSSREGVKGLMKMYRSIVKKGRSIFILPDGSKGPIYKAKAGAVVLSKMTQAPLQPVSWSADRYWEAGSWDRMIIPKPFARIVLSVAPAISIDKQASEEEQEEARQKLENILTKMREDTDGYFSKRIKKNEAARAL